MDWQRRPMDGGGGKTFFLAEGSLLQMRVGDRQTRAGKSFHTKGPEQRRYGGGNTKGRP